MPTRDRPENRLISLFLSAYENDTWQGCTENWLDEKQDGAVEILATRLSDGATLAIEHTLIQPYPEHEQEKKSFDDTFDAIRNDPSLIVCDRGIDVYLLSGTLSRGRDWKVISSAIHGWLRENVRVLPVGFSDHLVGISEALDGRLRIKVVEEQGYEGDFFFGIDGGQLPADTLGLVVENALTRKVEKLVNTVADRRILMLERREMTLGEDLVWAAIESKRDTVEKLDEIHEVWFVENVRSFGTSNFVRFSMRDERRITKFLDFYKGLLHRRYGS